jgi:hypothetical protein
VSSDKILYNTVSGVTIQGNSLSDSADSHPLEFENKEGRLNAWITDDDVVAINWAVSFYPKGVTNYINPNNGVQIDNSNNLILIWSSNNGYIAVFAQTDSSNS